MTTFTMNNSFDSQDSLLASMNYSSYMNLLSARIANGRATLDVNTGDSFGSKVKRLLLGK